MSKTKKTKEIRAWAVITKKGSIVKCACDLLVFKTKQRSIDMSLGIRGETIVPVSIKILKK